MVHDLAAQKRKLSISAPYYLKQHDLEKRIFQCFKNAGYPNVESVRKGFLVFDLSETYWHDLGALLWLISLLHRLRKQENELQLILPEVKDDKGGRVWDFLIRWRFFETLSVCVDDPVNLLKPSQVSYMTRGSQYAIPLGTDDYGAKTILHTLNLLEIVTIRIDSKQFDYDSLLDRFLKKFYEKVVISSLAHFCGWNPSLTKTFIDRIMGEGLKNTLLHSKGSFSNISMNIDSQHLTVVICDNGIGIPRVLREAFEQSRRHKKLVNKSDAELINYFTTPAVVLLDSDLIKYSVQKGTTSEAGRSGLGLYYLKSLVLKYGGELRIRSGKACVDFTKSKEEAYEKDLLDSAGTMIRIQTPRKV